MFRSGRITEPQWRVYAKHGDPVDVVACDFDTALHYGRLLCAGLGGVEAVTKVAQSRKIAKPTLVRAYRKPCIVYDTSQGGVWFWRCSGSLIRAWGRTPLHAYLRWLSITSAWPNALIHQHYLKTLTEGQTS